MKVLCPSTFSPQILTRHKRAGLVDPLRQEPDANGGPRASADPADFCVNVRRLKRAPNVNGIPQILRDVKRTLKSAPKQARILQTHLQTDLTPKEVHLLHRFWGNSHHMPLTTQN